MDIKIIRGSLGDDELAALVAVLATSRPSRRAAAHDPVPEPTGRPGWLDVTAPPGRFTVTGSWPGSRRWR
ncbi:acyl-CoA carboxylase subunit epsilon [Spirillospora albida]|uniref:acyl-CoA carboxylase subunit epsilon n=1 Tax=Spirillospora albida TaxID=58123 RepID=UPI0004C2880C|nr:acyl-CoA carboxylase subunit epsilon [Spirillospora albida]